MSLERHRVNLAPISGELKYVDDLLSHKKSIGAEASTLGTALW